MRIVTTHDVFRGAVFDLPDPEQSVGPWFWTLVAKHATKLGHRVDRFSLMENGAPRCLLAAADREALPRDHRGWAWLFSNPEALGTVADLIAPLLEADLVVGFELPPNMICVLARAGRRFLDFGQDPIRFCPDLFLRIRGNIPHLSEKLAAWAIADEFVRAEAAALTRRLGPGGVSRESVLFAGQIPIDSSLIAGAAVTRVEPFLDKIRDRLGDRPLLLKPHPLAPKSADLLALYGHFPQARFVDDNIYALLARPGVADVVTLSSSVAAEAPFFGKQATTLIVPDTLGPPLDSVSRFHRVGAGVVTTAFWGRVLHDMPGFMFVEAPPRSVRSRFSVGWGFVADMAAVAPRDIAEGETVSFAKGGRGPSLCLFGWSEPEHWGLWSDGTEALLQFVPPAGWNAFVAELRLTPHVPDPARPLAVSVIARGGGREEAMSFRFETQKPAVAEIPLTGGAIPGPIELLFRIADPVSPRQSNGGDDVRKLGLGLHEMTVRRLAPQSKPSANAWEGHHRASLP